MARAILNSAISRARGRIGNIELRRYKGTTVIQKVQERHQPWSGRQHQCRHGFKLHTAYAARVRDDPELRKLYAPTRRNLKDGLNYWQAAIRDHAHPPELAELHLNDYRPERGGRVSVAARDNFKVARVTVAVRDADGGVLQFAEAVFKAPHWEHIIPPSVPGERPPASIVFTAFDTPGNFAIGTYPLPC